MGDIFDKKLLAVAIIEENIKRADSFNTKLIISYTIIIIALIIWFSCWYSYSDNNNYDQKGNKKSSKNNKNNKNTKDEIYTDSDQDISIGSVSDNSSDSSSESVYPRYISKYQYSPTQK
jgi:hypothetical protein